MTASLIGRVVGPIGGRAVSGATSAVDDTGQGVDFAIADLGFKLAISDKRPYERATAQFKKDQFDSAPVPGEQGLTGWWLRSQASFHKGAGVDYYEVLDGETILNRSSFTQAVDTSTGGKVTLAREVEVGTANSIREARTLTNITNNYLFMEKSSGAFTKVQLGSSIASPVEVTMNTTSGTTIQGMTSSPFWLWVINGNKIERLTDPTLSTTSALITNTDPTNWHGVWYFKGRLWAVDANGRFYMMAGDSVVSVTTADSFGNSAEYLGFLLNSVHSWKATEVPSGILFARDNKVFLVTVDVSGAAPVPTPPVLVAELPSDESIASIKYALGLVCIATNLGVRFATVSTDGVNYGPLVARDADFSSCTSIGVAGDKFYATGRDSGRQVAGAYAFDVGNLVTDLEPAWGLELPFSTYAAASNYTGAWVSYAGVWSWSSSVNQIRLAASPSPVTMTTSDHLAQSGTLTTGYHRFGTLEPKKFHSVAIRVGGTSGTIGVARVMDDGSTVDLYTVDVSQSSAEDITLGLDTPQTRVALKFTLTRGSATSGPELLGYQLRALPSPRRQRMIRVPLELFDMERTKGARSTGRVGSAWTRLQALEDMETSGGTFQFKDYRTGEAGECYIESVEHQGMTPPGRGDPAFGGIVYVTLRKL